MTQKEFYKKIFFTQSNFMGYYNYHAVARKLISSGHCTHAEIKHKHNSISPALVLYFDNHKPMPIREKSFEEYVLLLKFCGVQICKNIEHSSILDKK